MARQLGGPLLCVGDLLSDLSLQDDDNNYNDSQQCSSSTFPQSQQTLHEIFENNYKDLNVALMNSDHSWTSLTQKVCTALKIADKLVQTSHVELEQLLEKGLHYEDQTKVPINDKSTE
ncbi:hypothetical protein SUGI_1148480 [Cryptomeria japonica]|nr:hypothetical protein SUGI_1148480 [Cryptomeria japonica]